MIANSHKFKAVTLNKQSEAKYKYRNDRESRMKNKKYKTFLKPN